MGVTVAKRLLESFSNKIEITLISEAFSPNTTSDVSAGFWKPYCLDGCCDELIKKWGKETYYRILNEALSDDAAQNGIQILPAYVLNSSEKVEIPFWADDVAEFRILDKSEISHICAPDPNTSIRSGITFTTTTITVHKYISYVMKVLKLQGVKFIQRKLTNLTEYVNDSSSEIFDYMINCVGLGALEFCNDTKMKPVRGQVLRVKAPWCKRCIILEHEVTYILPLTELVVLGGTQEPGIFNKIADDETCEQILERCSKLMPSLKNAEIVDKTAGLRPLREGGIRLELELIRNRSGKTVKVIHNYGHGGSGVTLCWGCATEVCDIIKSDLKLKTASNL